MKFSSLLLAVPVAAAPGYTAWWPSWGSNVQPIASAIGSIFPKGVPLTSQILQTFLQPNQVNFARNSYVYRQGTTLRLLGDHWTASGANVYWLGLDENVIPPEGEPFYAPFNASYPTHGRITEAMKTLVTMGAKLIRSQTIGVSVGNPLSVMPTKGVINQAAFDSIDWAVFQARQHGLRIIAPLVDDYVSLPRLPLSFSILSPSPPSFPLLPPSSPFIPLVPPTPPLFPLLPPPHQTLPSPSNQANIPRITTTAASSISSAGQATT